MPLRRQSETLGRCWCGGQVRYEFGYCGRHGLWCQFGHPVSDKDRQAFDRVIDPKYGGIGK